MKPQRNPQAREGTASLCDVLASLPKTIHSEVLSEVTYHLKQQTTAKVPDDADSFGSFLDQEQSRDPLISERVRSIAEGVLRDQVTRHYEILSNCDRAAASQQSMELEAVKDNTRARLQQMASAYSAVRQSSR